MSISISNIAWNPDEDGAVAQLLGDLCVHHIDVAPSKYFPAPAEASDAAISRVRGSWEALGIRIIGMQSLLFGTAGLNVFAPADVQLRIQPLPGGFKFRSVLLKLADALHVLVVLAVQPCLRIDQLTYLARAHVDLLGTISRSRHDRAILAVAQHRIACAQQVG